MAKRQRKTKPAYSQITSKLGQLTREELDDLIEVVTQLREAMGKSPEEQHKELERWRVQSAGRAQAEEGPC